MSASRKLTAAHGLEVAFGNLEGFVTHSQNKCGEVIRNVWRRTAVRFRLIGIIHRGFGGAAYMQMTQIAQCSAVFCAHAPSKIWVPQMFIARELGHVLENAQSLLDSFLSLRRQIAPGGQHIILNVIALLRGHLLPHPLAVAHVLLLLWGQLPKTSLILKHPLLVFGAEALLLIVSIRIVIVLPASRILPVS